MSAEQDPGGGHGGAGESARALALARRLSNGETIDWRAAEDDARGNGEETSLVQWLRGIAPIVEAHRTMHGTGPEERPEATPAADSPPEFTWGHLEVLTKIGQGAYGEVYRARDPRLDRVVALKLLRPGPAGEGSPIGAAGEEAALREGRILARLRHPHVVAVHGAERHDGRVGIWMEYLRGRTLSQILREQGTLGAREAGLVGLDLCQALAAVHRAGLVHRDLKAQNVLREEGGRIVLADFGTGADRIEADPGGGRQLSGTPMYMAPELFAGDPASPQSDVYSLGVLLYHLVSGGYPVEGKDLDTLREIHSRRRSRPLGEQRPDLPPAFIRVVEKALQPDPAARYGSAAAMEQALAAALGLETAGAAGIAEAAKGASTALATPGAGRRRTLILAAAAGAVLAIAALALVVGRWSGRDRGAGSPTATKSPAAALSPATTAPATAEPPPAASDADTSLPAAEPYTVEAAFYRGTRVRERLGAEDRLRVGEALSLEFKASRDLYLYVINEDDDGQAVLLYPLRESPGESLAGGETHLVPGRRTGTQQYWQVTSAGGREHFLVIASPERLAELEAVTQALLHPEQHHPLQYVRLSEETKLRLRGVAGLVEGPPPASGARSRLFEGTPRLAPGPEMARGAWMRRLDLDNIGR